MSVYQSKIKNIRSTQDIPDTLINGGILMNSTGEDLSLGAGGSRIIAGEWTDELDELLHQDERAIVVPTILQENSRIGVYKITDSRLIDLFNSDPSEIVNLGKLLLIGCKIPEFNGVVTTFTEDKIIPQYPPEYSQVILDTVSCFDDNLLITRPFSNDTQDYPYYSEFIDFFSNNGFLMFPMIGIGACPTSFNSMETFINYADSQLFSGLLEFYGATYSELINIIFVVNRKTQKYYAIVFFYDSNEPKEIID